MLVSELTIIIKQATIYASQGDLLSLEDARFLADFIGKQCPSFLTAVKGEAFEQLLSPPTATCYECSSNLVKYHECRVRCYITAGFESATLQHVSRRVGYAGVRLFPSV